MSFMDMKFCYPAIRQRNMVTPFPNHTCFGVNTRLQAVKLPLGNFRLPFFPYKTGSTFDRQRKTNTVDFPDAYFRQERHIPLPYGFISLWQGRKFRYQELPFNFH